MPLLMQLIAGSLHQNLVPRTPVACERSELREIVFHIIPRYDMILSSTIAELVTILMPATAIFPILVWWVIAMSQGVASKYSYHATR